MITTRKSEIKDLPLLRLFAEGFATESARYQHLGVNVNKVVTLLERFTKDDTDGVVLIAESNGNVLGGFVGAISEEWQSDRSVAFDLINYVMPEARSLGVGKELAKAFVEWGKAKGAGIIQCGTATGVNTEHAVELYSSLGFTEQGKFLELRV